MYHTPPLPEPLIIQGAHFEFHEPQILPAAQTFEPNSKERKQPEFYKFWVLKDLPWLSYAKEKTATAIFSVQFAKPRPKSQK